MRAVHPLILLLPASISFAQIHSTVFSPREWMLPDQERIRLGQVSLVHDLRGPRLTVQAVYPEGFFTSGYPVQPRTECLEISDFSHAFVNRVGGTYSVFFSQGTTADFQHGVGRRSNGKFAYSVREKGFAGFWMHLFNSAAPRSERTYLDATKFESVRITVRGTSGGEQLVLKVADDVWNDKEDALAVDDLGVFLPAGRVDTVWQTAVIPLSALPARISTSRLASIVLEARGSGAVEISSVAFCAAHPLHDRDTNEQPPPAAVENQKAIWVWNTRELIGNTPAFQEMTDMLRQERFTDVFLALPYDPDHPDAAVGVPIDARSLGPLIRKLNASGLRVHALVGDKDFIRPDKRTFVRTTLGNVARYQGSAPRSDQFYGIHLDIEPYLLAGFSSPRRPWFLQNLLEVLALCAEIARDARLVIGADIPPWLDAPDELTQTIASMSWNGELKPVYQHIIDMMDFVALMDYRTSAGGEGGVAFQAANELRYAESKGKSIMIGLETVQLPDETLFRFRGDPQRGIPDPSVSNAVIVGVGTDTMAILLLNKAHNDLASFLQRSRIDQGLLIWWPVDRSTRVRASDISFASKEGLEELRKVKEETGRILRGFSSFGGFAIHDYKGYRALTQP